MYKGSKFLKKLLCCIGGEVGGGEESQFQDNFVLINWVDNVRA